MNVVPVSALEREVSVDLTAAKDSPYRASLSARVIKLLSLVPVPCAVAVTWPDKVDVPVTERV